MDEHGGQEGGVKHKGWGGAMMQDTTMPA